MFGGRETLRLTSPDGRIGHAEIKLGDSVLMLADEFPEYGISGPPVGVETGFQIHLHVEHADAVIRTALEAGAELVRAAQDQFYGERSGKVRDPFGHSWMIGHSIEKVSPEEMQRRYDALGAD